MYRTVRVELDSLEFGQSYFIDGEWPNEIKEMDWVKLPNDF